MNMTDLMMHFFTPSKYQAQPPATDDGTDDWGRLQRQFSQGNTADNPNRAAAWQSMPDKRLPAYSQTTGSNQSGTSY